MKMRLPILLALFAVTPGFGFARQAPSNELQAIDRSINDVNNSVSYLKKLEAKLDTVIFIPVGPKRINEFFYVDKTEFANWASTEILTGAMSQKDIETIVRESTAHKKDVRAGMALKFEQLRNKLVGLQSLRRGIEHDRARQEQELKARQEKERKQRQKPPVVVDEWVTDDPTIDNRGSIQGSAESISGTIKRDGKTGKGSITISGIPKRVKEGDTVHLTLTASSSGPTTVTAWFNLNNCASKVLRNESATTANPPKPEGTCEFIFHGGSNPYIQISGGLDVDSAWSVVTFKYHKANK